MAAMSHFLAGRDIQLKTRLAGVTKRAARHVGRRSVAVLSITTGRLLCRTQRLGRGRAISGRIPTEIVAAVLGRGLSFTRTASYAVIPSLRSLERAFSALKRPNAAFAGTSILSASRCRTYRPIGIAVLAPLCMAVTATATGRGQVPIFYRARNEGSTAETAVAFIAIGGKQHRSAGGLTPTRRGGRGAACRVAAAFR